jgi:glycosyltransferase involved in cell wall biosynthesis
MPAYNEEKTIKRAAESILNQSHRDIELIIVNDGSTDGTVDLIKSLSDSRICLINKDHTGIVDSLNIGIGSAKGEYIARLDADDVSVPNRLQTQIEFMERHPDIALAGTWAYKIDLAIKRIIECRPPTEHKQIIRYMQKDNPFIHSSVIAKKIVFESVGNYAQFSPMEDYELWIRVAKSFRVANVPAFLIIRYESDNLASRPVYHGHTRTKMYAMRLKRQLEALSAFGVRPESALYLFRTIALIYLSRLRRINQ